MHTIKIDVVLNGFVCEVGCQRVVYQTREALLEELRKYLTDPQATEKEYQGCALNARIIGCGDQPDPGAPLRAATQERQQPGQVARHPGPPANVYEPPGPERPPHGLSSEDRQRNRRLGA